MRRVKRLVQAGYDQIAQRFAAADTSHVAPLVTRLVEGLPANPVILDLGCGSGNEQVIPLASRFRLVGVDISRGQLRLAQSRMPLAALVQADLGALQLAPASLDGISALYSIIHLPREEHEPLFKRLHEWLRPGGRALVVLGGADTPIGYEEDWFGAPMYWSHFDAETGLDMLRGAGFDVTDSSLVNDPLDEKGGAHLFALCRRP